MIININEKLIETLNTLALERSMTSEVYVEEYLENHLMSQYKKVVVNKVENENIENLASIEDVIDTKKAEIKAKYDLANPVVELEDIIIDETVIEDEESTSTDKIK